MPDDLGARLLDAGLVTRALLSELDGLRGGALVEALVAAGISESSLAGFFLTEGFGPLQRREDLMSVRARTLARLPPEEAHSLRVLPMGESPAGLVVAMADPSDMDAVGRIRRLTGSGVLPTVARAGDLRVALDHHYRRPPPGAAADVGSAPGGPGPGEQAAPARERSQGEEEVVLELVRRRRASAPPADPPGAPAAPDEPLPLTRTKSSTPPRAPAPPGSRDGPDSVPPAPEEHRWSDLAPFQDCGGTGRAPRGSPSSAPDSGPPPGPDPAQLAAALATIRGARSRDAIVRVACEAGLGAARRVVFLALRKGVLKGWDGAGGRISAAALQNLWIPVTSASMFRHVLEQGEAYDGAYGETAADHLFRSAIDGRGRRVVLQPVQVHERLVGILCADDVPDGDTGRQALARIADAVGEAFRRLLTASKG